MRDVLLGLGILLIGGACMEYELPRIDKDKDGYPACRNDQELDAWGEKCDCNDNDFHTNPGAVEVCDNYDNDCDNKFDEGLPPLRYLDNDGDGHGNPDETACEVDPPGNYIEDGTDCDDNDPNNFPGNDEVCDNHDNDCDDEIDEGLAAAYEYYPDNDGDSYPVNDPDPIFSCEPVQGYAKARDDGEWDCEDEVTKKTPFPALINPGMAEVFCNDVDENCDGEDECGGDFDPRGAIEIRSRGLSNEKAEDIGAGMAILGRLEDPAWSKIIGGQPHPNAELVGKRVVAVSAPLSEMVDPTKTSTTIRNAGAVHLLWIDPHNPNPVIDLETFERDSNYFHLVIRGKEFSSELGRTLVSGDFDGDGLQDLAIGAPKNKYWSSPSKTGAVFVYLGRTIREIIGASASDRAERIELELDDETYPADMVIVRGEDSKNIGEQLLALDLNRDGFDDLVVASPQNGRGSVSLVYGGADGMTFGEVSTVPQQPWSQAWFYSEDNDPKYLFSTDRATQTFEAGAMDKDLGYALADIGSFFGETSLQWAMSAPKNKVATKHVGQVFLFSTDKRVTGGDARKAPWAWSGLAWDDKSADGGFGSGLAGVGDINCDGFDDIAVGAPGMDTRKGRVYLFTGQKESDQPAVSEAGDGAAYLLVSSSADRFVKLSEVLVGLGDLNADGCDDFAIASPQKEVEGVTSAGEVLIIYGREDKDWQKAVDPKNATRKEIDLDTLDMVRRAGSRDRNSEFGSGIVSGYIDADTYPDFMISSVGANGGAGHGPGAVYVHLSSHP